MTVRSRFGWPLLTLFTFACATAPPPNPAPAPAAGAPAVAAAPLPPAAPVPAPPPAVAAAPAVTEPAPQTAWATMGFNDRRQYMKTVVLPRMKEVFIAYDATRYAKMTCTTCHGDGASEGTFRMPNGGLPKLPGTPEGFKKLVTDKPAMSQFMLTKVKPTMARLLGLPEMTPDNKTGFGCMSCHTR